MSALLRLLLIAVLTAAALTSVVRAEISSEPILRIELEQHDAVINQIGVDREGRFLVTASGDKTARVWSLPDGKLLKVLRPPIGPGDQGKLYAVAVSPDGSSVAVGGCTGAIGNGTTDRCVGPTKHDGSVYLFDLKSGQIVRRLKGLENAVTDLAFSGDGTRLAAGLAQSYGIRVWRVADGELLTADRDYLDDVGRVTFAADGRLAATSDDGFMRLYDPQLQRISKKKAPAGIRPSGVAFSADGSSLAVGYKDVPVVSVLSGSDLAPLFVPDLSGVIGGSLSSVGWSTDGRSLFAGGRHGISESLLFLWAHGGRGARTAIPTTTNTITGLQATPSGLVIANYDPAFSLYTADGQRQLFRGPEQPDLRNQERILAVARNGRSVRFGREMWGKLPVRFDLDRRQVTVDPPEDKALTTARTSAAHLSVTEWNDETAPKLNGKRLALQQYEKSQSLAIAPDGNRFALGTYWSLRLFDSEGEEVWPAKPVPGVAWAVNITGDGRMIVAGYADGTIRWHRISDGEEVLALFVHRDGQRWVAWTPDGYYDASANGDTLIGWHVNRGPDQAADFFPAAQFRDRFYRPDVIARVLDTLDVGEALRQADAARGQSTKTVSVAAVLPPVIEIVSPRDGIETREATLDLTYRVRSPTGKPITEVFATADGRPLPLADVRRTVLTTAKSEESGLVTVSLPPSASKIALLAKTEDGQSEPAVISVGRPGGRPGSGSVLKGNLYVLAVGVRDYQNYQDLKYADRDAIDFAARMQAQEGRLFGKVWVHRLVDAEATKQNIETGLGWLRREVNEGDVGVVFFSGHGKNDLWGDYYFLPHNVDETDLFGTAVPKRTLRAAFDGTVGKVVVFIDSCHAGGVQMASKEGAPDINGLLNELSAAGRGVVVFASSTGKQLSIELPEYEHGAFTQALLEALAGGRQEESADYNHDGAIATDELPLYIRKRVMALTKDKGSQTPVSGKPAATPDFPFAVVR